MKSIFAVVVLALALSGCAGGLTIGTPPGTVQPTPAQEIKQLPSPEAQIVYAANAVAAAATLGTTLLKNDKISVANAKSYKAILDTAAAHLHTAADELAKCRAATMSRSDTRPDPCAPTVWDNINLGLSIAADVQKVLGAK